MYVVYFVKANELEKKKNPIITIRDDIKGKQNS